MLQHFAQHRVRRPPIRRGPNGPITATAYPRDLRGRQFNTVEDLAAHLPGVSYEAIETTVIGAIRRGLLGRRINKTEMIDGNILIVSGIRG